MFKSVGSLIAGACELNPKSCPFATGRTHVSWSFNGTSAQIREAGFALLSQKKSSRTLRSAATSNPSFNLTRYGKRCKPWPRHMVHHRSPGLQRLPTRAG